MSILLPEPEKILVKRFFEFGIYISCSLIFFLHLGFWSRMFSRSTADDDRSPGGKGYGLAGAGEKMTVNDFHLLKIVGKGAFGKANEMKSLQEEDVIIIAVVLLTGDAGEEEKSSGRRQNLRHESKKDICPSFGFWLVALFFMILLCWMLTVGTEKELSHRERSGRAY
jgi:hypothetical protein